MLAAQSELPDSPLKLRSSCQIRYDPALPVRKDLLTAVWNANLASISGRILLDSGAYTNFIDVEFCRRNGIAFSPASSSIVLGDGRESEIVGKCWLPEHGIKIQHSTARLELTVCALSAQLDVVLGETWFKAHAALLGVQYCWLECCLCLEGNSEAHTESTLFSCLRVRRELSCPISDAIQEMPEA